MAMANQLASLGARSGQAHAVKCVVETPLQHVEHVLAGDTLGRAGFFEQIAELAFEKLIVASRFLLLAKLEAVADNLRLTIFAVLPRREVALLDGALLGIAALAFQKQFHALAPALTAHGTNISSQIRPPWPLLLGKPLHSRCSLQGALPLRPAYKTKIKRGVFWAAGSHCAESACDPGWNEHRVPQSTELLPPTRAPRPDR